jgi:hypothetical protein
MHQGQIAGSFVHTRSTETNVIQRKKELMYDSSTSVIVQDRFPLDDGDGKLNGNGGVCGSDLFDCLHFFD